MGSETIQQPSVSQRNASQATPRNRTFRPETLSSDNATTAYAIAT
jgi:hypothetical protein